MPRRSKKSKMGNHASQQAGGFKPAYTPSQSKRTSGAHYVRNVENPTAVNTSVPVVGGEASQPSVGNHSRDDAHYKAKRHRGRKIAIAAVAIVLVVLVGAGTAAAMYLGSLDKAISADDEEEIAAIDAALTPSVSGEPFYMLIIGSDTRNNGTGQRSDTNIVARIDPETMTITLISIPRDTAIEYESYGMVKFNAAYSYDGVKGAISAAEDLLGIKISHYVELDFDGLVDLIDAVGGVEVDVPMDIDDSNAGGSIDAGLQTLDGEQALIFARSRSYVTGDFQRTTNQRLLVEAFIEKVMTLSATELPSLVKSAAECFTTDMSLTDIIGYVQTFQDTDDLTIYSCLVPSTTAEIDGVSYVICDTDELEDVMEAIENSEDPSEVTSDSTVSSSEEAEESGQESTPVY